MVRKIPDIEDSLKLCKDMDSPSVVIPVSVIEKHFPAKRQPDFPDVPSYNLGELKEWAKEKGWSIVFATTVSLKGKKIVPGIRFTPIPKENSIPPQATEQPHKKEWYEKPAGIVFLMVLGTIIAAFFIYHFGLNGSKGEIKQSEAQKESAMPATDTPKKIPSVSPTSKKSLKTIATSTINAQNSNIFIGSNTGTVNQTINNLSEPKHIPFRDRLISCLDEIDKRIIPALRSGITQFKFKLTPYQLADLQKLAAEPDASRYIILKIQPGIIFRKTGNVTLVFFELKPALLL